MAIVLLLAACEADPVAPPEGGRSLGDHGVRDADGDGAPDAACCNAQPDGTRRCCDDCDDADPSASPLGTEVCDPAMHDEDCDGEASPDALCSCADGAMRACTAPGRCGSGT